MTPRSWFTTRDEQAETSTTGSHVRISIRCNQTQKSARRRKTWIRKPSKRVPESARCRTILRENLEFRRDLGRVGNRQAASLSISISYQDPSSRARKLAVCLRRLGSYLSASSWYLILATMFNRPAGLGEDAIQIASTKLICNQMHTQP